MKKRKKMKSTYKSRLEKRDDIDIKWIEDSQRKHISLTIEQVEAAELGELQLEFRCGNPVISFKWNRPPFNQRSCQVLEATSPNGNVVGLWWGGFYEHNRSLPQDIFIRKPK